MQGLATDVIPNGWRLQKTADGRTYYLDDVSQTTSWEKPNFPTLADHWSVRYDDTGRQFFANDVTYETRWSPPELPAYATAGQFMEDQQEQPDFEPNAPPGENLPSYDQAMHSSPDQGALAGYQRSQSNFAGPDLYGGNLASDQNSIKQSQTNVFGNYNDPPPKHPQMQESADCGTACARLSPGFWCQAVMTVCVWIAILMFLVFDEKDCDYYYCSTSTEYIVAAIMISVGAVGMWSCGFQADCRHYLNNVRIGQSPYKYIDKLKENKATIEWIVQCYHYRTVRTKNGTRRKRVNTHRANKNFQYLTWRDVSPKFGGMEEFKVMQLHVSKKFGFDSEQMHNHYNTTCTQWKAHHNRDTHQDFHCNIIIPEYTEYALYEMEDGALPACLKDACGYLLATFLSVGIFFRLWFQKNCGHKKFTIEKEIGGIVPNQGHD